MNKGLQILYIFLFTSLYSLSLSAQCGYNGNNIGTYSSPTTAVQTVNTVVAGEITMFQVRQVAP